jgi:2'-hydroxyisoflavone reductase
VQFIDARDLAEWMVALLGRGAGGAFNATGPRAPVAMEEVLEACRVAAGGDAAFEWIDEPFLAAQGVRPWMEMPLWVPESDPHAAAFMNVPIERALAAGLRFRDLSRTVADTLAWERTRPAQHEWKAGLAPSREDDLLAAWDRRPRPPAG